MGSRMHQFVRASCLVVLLPGVGPSVLADADLRIFKGVDNSFPASGNPVSFDIVVTNGGPDRSRSILVSDRLPDGLRVPDGLGIFLSQGTYDPAEGTWALGELLPGESATLAIPAIPEQFSVPACYVNRAEITAASTADPRADNDAASAAVYVGGLRSCAHLNLEVVPELVLEPDCSNDPAAERLVFNIAVSNSGPDDAEDVQVFLTGTHPELVDAAANDVLNLGVIPSRSSAAGTLSWRFRCGQSPSTANYVIDVETATPVTEDSTLSVSDTFQIPDTGDCDCSVWPSDGSRSGCFFTTALYGSSLHPYLRSLRRFRDRFLLSHAIGRRIVDFYYQNSPPLADAISRSDSLRGLARGLIGVAAFGIEHPWRVLALPFWGSAVVVSTALETSGE